MPINTKCPTCKRTLEIPDELMGKKVRCPSCKVVFLATAGGTPPPPKTESSRPQPPKSKSEEGIRVRRRPPPADEEDEEEEEEEEETPRVRKKGVRRDRKSTRLNSSHQIISYAVFCLKKKNTSRTMA